jgi:peptidoglycan LD-endopeptidase CwlK
MNAYSAPSEKRLATCHPDLQRLFRRVLEHVDHKILEGHRGEAAQNEAFRTGHSKLRWPHGKHNSLPSRAVDAAPVPLDWKDRQRFIEFAAVVMSVAAELKLRIRWGGDWDGNPATPNRFDDLVHFELLPG